MLSFGDAPRLEENGECDKLDESTGWESPMSLFASDSARIEGLPD
jgi:hypothetical protein